MEDLTKAYFVIIHFYSTESHYSVVHNIRSLSETKI